MNIIAILFKQYNTFGTWIYFTHTNKIVCTEAKAKASDEGIESLLKISTHFKNNVNLISLDHCLYPSSPAWK